MSDKLLYDVKDIQRLLGLGKNTVYTMIWSGELPSIKIGKLLKVPADDLAAWIQTKKQENAPLGGVM